MRLPLAGSGWATWAPRCLAVGALALAVTSRGELGLLALLLLVPDVTLVSAIAATGAVVASSWRWGTTSLDALAGAQAVLGPAGGVGPAAAAAGSWLAGAALLLAFGRGRDPVRCLAAGATVAAVLAGPAPGGELPVRVVVGLGAAAGAWGLARWRAEDRRIDRLAGALAAAAGIGAVVSVVVAGDARPASVDLGLVGQGAAIALAAGLVAVQAERGARWRPGGPSPTVMLRPGAVRAPEPRTPSR